MLILFLILSLLRHLQGAPLSTINTFDPENSLVPRDDSTDSHFGTRQINDIVVSCLTTIFACTWTAIHPNIPGPTDSGWVCLKRQITTMIYALLAPEAITAWAMRQHFAARGITENYNDTIADNHTAPKLPFFSQLKHSITEWFDGPPMPEGLTKGKRRPWTVTHGFFVQMGGFILCENGKPLQSLQYHELHTVNSPSNMGYLIENGIIDAPTTTEADILDRSKGDGLAKTFVVLQTTWFIVQCITRWSRGLPVTELEIVTLGFAMLNALTYGLWWNKPQNVGVPVYLEVKRPSRLKRVRSKAKELGKESTPVAGDLGNGATQSEKEGSVSTNAPIIANLINEHAPVEKKRFLRRILEKDWITQGLLFRRIPYRVIQATIRPISRMMDFSQTYVEDGELRVPMFYCGDASDKAVFIASSVIASLFGLIHLIPAFFLDFPSHPERLLWQISVAIITGQPLVLGLWARFPARNSRGERRMRQDRRSLLAIIALVGVPFYIIARVTLIVLAFLSLRHLPPTALVSIDWITFIPHL